VLTLAPQGLVLGAGTILVPADGPHRLKSLEGQEARVLALLSAAYSRAVAPSVLGNIKRAAKAWGEGDDCLAYIHLAHARLPALQDQVQGRLRKSSDVSKLRGGRFLGSVRQANCRKRRTAGRMDIR
jgi:hypothetical protein